MGLEAEDLKEDYSQEFAEEGVEHIVWTPLEIEYEVSIVHRRTHEIMWTGVVTASSKRDAQSEFRKQYPHIRSQYSHEYGLAIRKL